MADLLLVEEFNDAVHEGDGERMLTVWKLLLLHFRTTGHTNYMQQRVITEASALLTDRGAHRLKWCRFINTKGNVILWGAGDRLHMCRLNTKCRMYSVLFFC